MKIIPLFCFILILIIGCEDSSSPSVIHREAIFYISSDIDTSFTTLNKINLDGTNETVIVSDATQLIQFNVSPDRKKIVYVANNDGDYDIYITDINGKGRHNLTNNDVNDYDPSWSPDSKMIAFTSEYDEMGEICIINAEGNNFKRLTEWAINKISPEWAPDGLSLVFCCTSEKLLKRSVYIIDT